MRWISRKKKVQKFHIKRTKFTHKMCCWIMFRPFFQGIITLFFSESVHFPLFRLAKVEEKLFCIVFARVKKKVQDFNESVVVSFLQYKKSIKSVDGGGLKIYFSSA
jgi:hypothetical protein